MIQKVIKESEHNKEFVVIGISKHMFDFNNDFSGMLFWKNKDELNQRVSSKSIILSNEIGYKEKSILGKLSELTIDQIKTIILPTDDYREKLNTILTENVVFKNEHDDYLILKVILSKLPDGWIDWNTLTLDQMVEHLENKYKFDSSGDSLCIYRLIEFYKKHK